MVLEKFEHVSIVTNMVRERETDRERERERERERAIPCPMSKGLELAIC